ncbi:iron chaperone [Ekhidna sp.]
MQYNATTPIEYLNLLEKDWRKDKLNELRAILLAQPDVKEGINYKMLSYEDDKGVIFHLNAQKNYVALYVGDAAKVDPTGELLEGIDHGKGCLRFKKSIIFSETNIEKFIKKAIDIWKQGGDIGC